MGFSADPRVILVDSRGDARPVAFTFAGPFQINFLVPAARRTGGAVLPILNMAKK